MANDLLAIPQVVDGFPVLAGAVHLPLPPLVPLGLPRIPLPLDIPPLVEDGLHVLELVGAVPLPLPLLPALLPVSPLLRPPAARRTSVTSLLAFLGGLKLKAGSAPINCHIILRI